MCQEFKRTLFGDVCDTVQVQPGVALGDDDGMPGPTASQANSDRQHNKRPSPRRVTLRDVAERAGVSRTTASFVTTGRRDMGISAEAEERVKRAAQELGYRPSLLARGLRTNLSQTIGLISDVVATEPYAGELIRGSMTTAIRHHQLMLIGESGGDSKVEDQLIHGMLDRGVRRIHLCRDVNPEDRDSTSPPRSSAGALELSDEDPRYPCRRAQ